ncbi:Transcriptional regulatory protein moc3 [Ilyonectria robusta]
MQIISAELTRRRLQDVAASLTGLADVGFDRCPTDSNLQPTLRIYHFKARVRGQRGSHGRTDRVESAVPVVFPAPALFYHALPTHPARVPGRKRKVKCGEERPSCRNCSTSRRQCHWPSSADLRDRRNLPRKGQGHVSPGSPGSATSSEDPECRGDAPQKTSELTLSTSLNTAASAIRSEVEVELIYHFLNKFFSLLVLPTWNKTYFLEYQFQLVSMMMHCDSVKYAVLASCAANKCILSNDRRYQHHALVYYSRAVRGVNQAVLQLHSRPRVPDDSLLATVVFLYLHDVRP